MIQNEQVNYQNEVWKPVPIDTYSSLYEVSNMGRVRSLDKYVNHPVKLGHRLIKGRILKPSSTKGRGDGYYFVGMTAGGENKYVTIHRLVALAFVPNPLNKKMVNHKDGNKHNNNDWNLEWNTPLENNNHARRTGLVPIGEGRRESKLTDSNVIYARMRYNNGGNVMAMAPSFGVCFQSLHNAIVGKTWKHVNYPPSQLRGKISNQRKLQLRRVT